MRLWWPVLALCSSMNHLLVDESIGRILRLDPVEMEEPLLYRLDNEDCSFAAHYKHALEHGRGGIGTIGTGV